MSSVGQPLPLLRHKDDGFEVDKSAFCDILSQSDLLDRKLVVISIVGEYRRGKSFFLNFVRRYLVNQGKSNWMEDEKESRLQGFSWRQGMSRETDGIVMWNRAFPLGDEYAVILLDTEGTYDEDSTNKTMSHVFACSALISSLQIYNVFERITKQTMQEIQSFAEFGSLASCSKAQHAFQNLVFLVRDWPHVSEFQLGIKGGQKYLEHWLKKDKDGVKQTLKTCFGITNCYLMPNPGDRVKLDSDFKGKISDMKPDFSQHLKEVIELMFSPAYLEAKKIGGKYLKLRDFMTYFPMFAKTLNESGVEPTTLFQAQVQICNNNAKHAALELYKKKMDCVTEGEEPVGNLNLQHEMISGEAFSLFDEQPKMGGQQHAQTYRQILFHDIQIQYSKYENSDTYKRVLQSKMEEKDKEIWRVENERIMQELHHKRDMENRERERVALLQEFDAKQQALAEEYNRKLQSVEQQAVTEGMKLQHEMHLKLEEMKKREDVTREEIQEQVAKNKIKLKELKKKYEQQVSEIQREADDNPFYDIGKGVVSVLKVPSFLFTKLKHLF